MRPILLCSVLTLGLLAAAPPPAQAIGCLSGGAMGAVAGHYTGHTILGAIGGCVLGRHLHDRQRAQAELSRESADRSGHGVPPGPGIPPAGNGPSYQPGYPQQLPAGAKPSPWTNPEAYTPIR